MVSYVVQKRIQPTSMSKENGRHSLKVLAARKELMNVGHVEDEKLLPIPVSKTEGNEVAAADADATVRMEATVLEVTVVVGLPFLVAVEVTVAAPVATEIVETSRFRSSCMRG